MKSIIYKVMDSLYNESDLFTDVERCILLDMLSKVTNRHPMYWHTPFIYTRADYRRLKFRYDLFEGLMAKLIEYDLVTTSFLPYKSAFVRTYQFHFTRMLELCENNKIDFSEKNTLTFRK